MKGAPITENILIMLILVYNNKNLQHEDLIWSYLPPRTKDHIYRMVIVEGRYTMARSSSLGANSSLVDTKV